MPAHRRRTCRRGSGSCWETRSRVIQKAPEYADFYAAYPPRLAVDQDGTIHALLSYYEGNESVGRGYHQAIGYACSPDGGRSWQRLDGSAVEAPGRPEDLDLFVQSSRTRIEPTPPPELGPGGVVVERLQNDV